MKCANPICQHHLHYLHGGSLRLLELECDSDRQLQGEDGGFPVCRRTARYFWLCPECSRILILRRWTQIGLVLQSRSRPAGGSPPTWTVPPESAIEVQSIRNFPTLAKSA